jgi:hypothetical protein
MLKYNRVLKFEKPKGIKIYCQNHIEKFYAQKIESKKRQLE